MSFRDCIEPSLLYGDAPCPKCGTLLWFACLPAGTVFYERDHGLELLERLKQKLAEQLGIPTEQITPARLLSDLGADSLDAVELEMSLEELLE